jgi:hypothetical protein
LITPSGDARLRELLRPGFQAIRKNWLPMLLIQVIAFLLVFSFYRFESVRAATAWISRAKESGGELFVIVAGACAGGVIPQIAKTITGKAGRIDRLFFEDSAYAALVFAVMAVQVDALYRCQIVFFGAGHDPATLAKKTTLDLFFFSPLLFNPVAMLMMHARQTGFKLSGLRDAFRWSFYSSRVLPTLPINWAFWIPILLCVYSLPSLLQFPFAQLAEACWSLVFLFIAEDAATK